MASGQRTTVEEFETAALPHLNDLYRTALRLASNSAEAEDLIQDVYLQAWKSFHRFELGTNCRAWLFKILINKNMRRSRNWFARAKASSDLIESLAYEPPVPEQINDADVLLGLENIPAHYRAAILLTDVEGFSYKEAADILSVPIGTVMSRLNRGRKLLRIEFATLAESYGIKSVERA